MINYNYSVSICLPAQCLLNSITQQSLTWLFTIWCCSSLREVSFGTLQYIQCILHGLTSVLLWVPFIFSASEKCQFGGCTWWLMMEMVCIFHGGYFDYGCTFWTVLDSYCCVMGWTYRVADNESFMAWMINDITEALGILLYCDTECGSPANIKKFNKLAYKGYNNFILCTTLACFSTFHLPTMVPKFRALVSIQ